GAGPPASTRSSWREATPAPGNPLTICGPVVSSDSRRRLGLGVRGRPKGPPQTCAKTDASADGLSQRGVVLASLKIDAQDLREAGDRLDGPFHVYGDDSVSRFSGKMLVR